MFISTVAKTLSKTAKLTLMVRFCGVLDQMRSAFLTAPDVTAGESFKLYRPTINQGNDGMFDRNRQMCGVGIAQRKTPIGSLKRC